MKEAAPYHPSQSLRGAFETKFMAKKPAKAKTIQWGRFALTEAEITRQITKATRRGAEELLTEPLATSVRFDRRSRSVVIKLNKGSTLCVPVELLQGLAGASLKDLSQIEIPNPGCEIEWPTLDQQFTIQGLLAGRFGTRSWMAALSRSTTSRLTPTPTAGRATDKKARRVRKAAATANA